MKRLNRSNFLSTHVNKAGRAITCGASRQIWVDQILDKQFQTVRIGQSKHYQLNGADVKIVVNGKRAKCLL